MSAGLTPEQRGRWQALQLQMRADPSTWRAKVDAIEDPAERKAADDYLRGIVARTRVVAALKRGKNPAP